MKRSHGAYSKHSRNFVSKGRLAITRQLVRFEVGDKVRFDANPSAQKGKLNTLRFNKRLGMVAATQGKAYKVRFMDGNKEKFLVVSNMHLVKV